MSVKQRSGQSPHLRGVPQTKLANLATLRAVPAFKRSPPHAIPIGYRDKVYGYRKSKHRMKRGDRCKKGIDAKSIAIVTAQRGQNGISHSDKDNDLN